VRKEKRKKKEKKGVSWDVTEKLARFS